MRRDIATIMALPIIASRRFSQCSTMSRAIRSSRSSAPTMASSRAQRDLGLLRGVVLDLLGDLVGQVIEGVVVLDRQLDLGKS